MLKGWSGIKNFLYHPYYYILFLLLWHFFQFLWLLFQRYFLTIKVLLITKEIHPLFQLFLSQKILFTNEDVSGCLNEEPISAISEAAIAGSRRAPRKQEELHVLFYFVFYCFSSTIINRSVFSRYSMILIILSFPALRAPRPLIFLSNLSTTGKGTAKWFFA